MADYTALDRFLHRLALSYPPVGELGFDVERRLFGSKASRRNAVYVTGLARAGTTMLMRGLYASHQFASLTYNDMPFVLAPNLWGALSRLNAKQRSLRERAHGDGIQIDFDSPEALEEVFWRLYCGSDYIQKDCLRIHTVNTQTVSKLESYQSLVCYKYGKNRYLGKNNNHILRIASLAEQSVNTTFLILFRDPVAQAQSLFRQHRAFLYADSFTRQYMAWLAHHEFGATHRPFRFSGYVGAEGSPERLNYWLTRWIDAYAYLLEVMERKLPNVYAVSYERLCTRKDDWIALCRTLELPNTASPFHKAYVSTDRNTVETTLDTAQLSRADSIYQALDQLARQSFSRKIHPRISG